VALLKKTKNVFYRAMSSNSSPHKLALSFSVGVFIAFSPFPGGHTVMMLASKWLMGLNFPILFFSTSFNNPWTMVPFYTFDYYFGHWFIHSLLGLTPAWAISVGKIFSLENIFGSGKICLWSFFIGGNVLGVLAAVISYPVMLWLFHRFMSLDTTSATSLGTNGCLGCSGNRDSI